MELPVAVETALCRLWEHGYEGYAVGGCVRDSLLWKAPNDWDIATSAKPTETCAVFSDCRVIQTGIAHGTVTVLMDGMPLEITTYRTDGDYLDHRHPVGVTFAACLEEDLARRDFTVNAMAYHPQRGLVDLFGGQKDLEQKLIRCVGEPERRFDEDGLRILRALRFAAVLDFDIHPDTAKALHAQRHLLVHIAAERIREELCKLLCGRGAARILREYRDVTEEFLPAHAALSAEAYERLMRALPLENSGDLITRFALLLCGLGYAKAAPAKAQQVMKALRLDNAMSAAVAELLAAFHRPLSAREDAVKRLLRDLSKAQIFRLLELRRCFALASDAADAEVLAEWERIPAVMEALAASGACFSLKTLAVKGNDLLAVGLCGKEIGAMLERLLEQVIDGVLQNEKNALLAEAVRSAGQMPRGGCSDE